MLSTLAALFQRTSIHRGLEARGPSSYGIFGEYMEIIAAIPALHPLESGDVYTHTGEAASSLPDFLLATPSRALPFISTGRGGYMRDRPAREQKSYHNASETSIITKILRRDCREEQWG